MLILKPKYHTSESERTGKFPYVFGKSPVYQKNQLGYFHTMSITNMNKTLLPYVGWLLLATAIGFYLFGIGKAVWISWNGVMGDEIKSYPSFISSSVSSLQGILIINLGALLGIATKDPGSAVASRMLMSTPGNIAGLNGAKNPLELKEQIQIFGVIILIVSLIVCLITWGKNNFVEDNTVLPIIHQSGKMFIGIIVAYFTLILK
jgi:hypothetical protein